MNFLIRDEFPMFLNNCGLMGTGAEIGVQNGLYSEILLDKWKGSCLISIDAWRHFEDSEYIDMANYTNEQNLDLYADTTLKLREFGERSIIWRMTSEEAAKIMPEKTLDFCYIDADHSYDGVIQDLELWIPKIKSGGIICGHDFITDGEYYDEKGNLVGVFGVEKAVSEYSEKNNWKLHITSENGMHPSWFAFIS